jgi:hypothetical protein
MTNAAYSKAQSEDLEIPEDILHFLKAMDAFARSAPGKPSVLKLGVLNSMRHAVTDSLAAASVKCPLGNPPTDITTRVDSTGNIHMECFHSNPQHCWDLSGHKQPC